MSDLSNVLYAAVAVVAWVVYLRLIRRWWLREFNEWTDGDRRCWSLLAALAAIAWVVTLPLLSAYYLLGWIAKAVAS